MAYGMYCQKCCGTVDRNEYDYAKDMCRECVQEMEQKELNKSKFDALFDLEFEQMNINLN